MKQLYKCHFNYLFSKTTIITVIIILLFILTGYLLSIDIFDNEIYNSFNEVINYELTVQFITKFLVLILTVFTYSYHFLPKNDQYSILIISSNVSKTRYLTSKIIVLLGFIFFNVLILNVFFFFFGAIFIKQFYFDWSYIIMFINIYLVCIAYGLYSILLVQLLKNVFSSIISFALMLIGEILLEQSNKNIAHFFVLLFPNISTGDIYFYYGYSHLFIIIIILFMCNIYIYNKRDL